MVKTIFIDTETTGLSPQKNTVWQIGGVIMMGEQEEQFNFMCCPLAGKEVDEKALIVGGVTAEVLRTYASAPNTFVRFKNLLRQYVDPMNKRDKFTMYGYNVPFDAGFLRQWFSDMGDKYFGSWFFHPPVDVMVLAAEILKEERKTLPDFKLGTVAKHLNIEIKEDCLHDALFDALLTRSVYYKLIERRTSVLLQ